MVVQHYHELHDIYTRLKCIKLQRSEQPLSLH